MLVAHVAKRIHLKDLKDRPGKTAVRVRRMLVTLDDLAAAFEQVGEGTGGGGIHFLTWMWSLMV